jgi:E3 ubiquitin-protein ligase synoviolin
MDQRPYPGPPPLFHIRALGLFVLLTLTDLVMLAYTVDSTLNHGISATLLFANEVSYDGIPVLRVSEQRPQYAILVTSVCNAMAKYAVGIYELRRASSRGGAQAPPWEAKSIYIFYIELLTGKHKFKNCMIRLSLPYQISASCPRTSLSSLSS